MANIRSSGKINDVTMYFKYGEIFDDDIPPEVDIKLVVCIYKRIEFRGDPSNIQVPFDRGDYKEYVKWKAQRRPILDWMTAMYIRLQKDTQRQNKVWICTR